MRAKRSARSRARTNLYGKISLETLKETIQSKHLRYDKKGEEHYNTISAFIKSMRASQPDAALYYLARMVDAGEDPALYRAAHGHFCLRRYRPRSPDGARGGQRRLSRVRNDRLPRSADQSRARRAYLATCKKSRASYDAYFEALADAKKHGNLPIPMNISNAPTKLMKDLGYHKGYKLYDKESYLPDKIKKKVKINRRISRSTSRLFKFETVHAYSGWTKRNV
jgi:putative ATPase